MTVRPNTNEVWVGDVGQSRYEEINRLVDPEAPPTNFGWPCMEGPDRYPMRATERFLDFTICQQLNVGGPDPDSGPPPSLPSITQAFYAYDHGDEIEPADCADPGGGATSGLEFYDGVLYPAELHGALFHADYVRRCIWAYPLGTDGQPDTAQIRTIVKDVTPVSLVTGPAKDLFFVDIARGEVGRIRALGGVNHPPTAVITADTTAGPVPLTVNLSGATSSDPNGDALTYEWDLDGDGEFDDSTGASPAAITFESAGPITVSLRVSDPSDASDTDSITVRPGETPPDVTITSPSAGDNWAVGDSIGFSATATDMQDGSLPESAFDWEVILHHCSHTSPPVCHVHFVSEVHGASSSSILGPDHDDIFFLEFQVTATDSAGLTTTVSRSFDPRLTEITIATEPAGLNLRIGDQSGPSPLTVELVAGSTVDIHAPSPQMLGGTNYTFSGWSVGGAASQSIDVPSSTSSWTATFAESPPRDGWAARALRVRSGLRLRRPRCVRGGPCSRPEDRGSGQCQLDLRRRPTNRCADSDQL